MKKFYAFEKMLAFMSDHAEVIDADMNTYNGDMMIVGETEDHVIRIEVSITKKEEKTDAEEVE